MDTFFLQHVASLNSPGITARRKHNVCPAHQRGSHVSLHVQRVYMDYPVFVTKKETAISNNIGETKVREIESKSQ